MEPTYYKKLLKKCYQRLIELQENIEKEYSLSNYASWQFTGEDDVLQFSSDDMPDLITNCQAVGIFDARVGIWAWSWCRADIPQVLKKDMNRIQLYGLSNGLQNLITEMWSATEEDCWQMTALTCNLLEGSGAYRIPIDQDLYVYTVITKVKVGATV